MLLSSLIILFSDKECYKIICVEFYNFISNQHVLCDFTEMYNKWFGSDIKRINISLFVQAHINY